MTVSGKAPPGRFHRSSTLQTGRRVSETAVCSLREDYRWLERKSMPNLFATRPGFTKFVKIWQSCRSDQLPVGESVQLAGCLQTYCPENANDIAPITTANTQIRVGSKSALPCMNPKMMQYTPAVNRHPRPCKGFALKATIVIQIEQNA